MSCVPCSQGEHVDCFNPHLVPNGPLLVLCCCSDRVVLASSALPTAKRSPDKFERELEQTRASLRKVQAERDDYRDRLKRVIEAAADECFHTDDCDCTPWYD